MIKRDRRREALSLLQNAAVTLTTVFAFLGLVALVGVM